MQAKLLFTCWVITVGFLTQQSLTEAAFKLTLAHTGDLHARFQQVDIKGAECSGGEELDGLCYGGFARLATAINDIRDTEENFLLLDTGDIFEGSLWFTHFKGKASSYFMNRLRYDVQVGIMILGRLQSPVRQIFSYGIQHVLE